jgi:hypothetical protein
MERIIGTLKEFFSEDNVILSDGRIKVSTILTILREVDDVIKYTLEKKALTNSLSEQSIAILCLIGIDLLGKVDKGSEFERNMNGQEYQKFLIENKFKKIEAKALWELRNSLIHEFSFGNYNSLSFEHGALVNEYEAGKYNYSISSLTVLLRHLKNRMYEKFSNMANKDDADSNPFLLITYAFLLEHGFYYKKHK